MPAEIYEICDAVVAAINAISPFGSISFTAQRYYFPLLDLPAISQSGNSAAQIVVMPTKDDISLIDRDETGYEQIQIEVAVMAKFSATIDPTNPSSNASIDPYVKLSRAVAMIFIPGSVVTIASGPNTGQQAQWMETKWPLTFDAKRLKDDRLLQSMITYTFFQ